MSPPRDEPERLAVPAESHEGDRRLRLRLEKQLKKTVRQYIDKCMGPDGRRLYAVREADRIRFPIKIPGPPNSSLECGSPAPLSASWVFSG
jgi:hypothetical protein